MSTFFRQKSGFLTSDLYTWNWTLVSECSQGQNIDPIFDSLLYQRAPHPCTVKFIPPLSDLCCHPLVVCETCKNNYIQKMETRGNAGQIWHSLPVLKADFLNKTMLVRVHHRLLVWLELCYELVHLINADIVWVVDGNERKVSSLHTVCEYNRLQHHPLIDWFLFSGLIHPNYKETYFLT